MESWNARDDYEGPGSDESSSCCSNLRTDAMVSRQSRHSARWDSSRSWAVASRLPLRKAAKVASSGHLSNAFPCSTVLGHSHPRPSPEVARSIECAQPADRRAIATFMICLPGQEGEAGPGKKPTPGTLKRTGKPRFILVRQP